VLTALETTHGGELYVPKIPSMRITDLAEAMAPGMKLKDVGIRPGEKLHEVLVTEDEARHCYDLGDRYVIFPQLATWGRPQPRGAALPDGFRYSSDENDRWIGEDELRRMADVLPPGRRASDRAQPSRT